jgi:hypothetical protein
MYLLIMWSRKTVLFYTNTYNANGLLESTANKLLDAFIAPWANRDSNSLAARVADGLQIH